MPLLSRLLTPKPGSFERDTFDVTLSDGRSIDILRVRDPRARRIKLSVDERGARLTLPARASLVAGDRFVREHGQWLAQQLDAHVPSGIASLVRGETAWLPLRDEQVPLYWEAGRYTRLRRAENTTDDVHACAAAGYDDAGSAHTAATLVFSTPPRAGDAALRRALRDFYEAQARADIARWLPKYLPTLPRAPSRIGLKAMSSQWGSLSPGDSLVLDLSLVLGAPPAFEYVLVHELCHLIRADHSPAFWHEVETRFPAWRAQRAYFHAEGRRLKACLRRLLAG